MAGLSFFVVLGEVFFLFCFFLLLLVVVFFVGPNIPSIPTYSAVLHPPGWSSRARPRFPSGKTKRDNKAQ